MRAQGWTFQKMPKRRQNALAYEVGNEKVYYAGGVTVGVKYCLALLSAPTLREKGILAIPHSLTEKNYTRLLAGQAVTGILAATEVDADAAAAAAPELEVDAQVPGEIVAMEAVEAPQIEAARPQRRPTPAPAREPAPAPAVDEEQPEATEGEADAFDFGDVALEDLLEADHGLLVKCS